MFLTLERCCLLSLGECDGFEQHYYYFPRCIAALIMLASFFARLFKMTNFAVKHSIMTQAMVENFCNNYYILNEVHPVALGQDKTITQFPEVPCMVGGVLEESSGSHLTARTRANVWLTREHQSSFRRYPECFLCLVGLSPYYPFDENTYPAFERPDGTEMGLLDFIKTADPWKVQAVEVQKTDDQMKLLESMSHCFMSLVTPVACGSSSAAAPEVSALAEVEPKNVVPEDTYLDLTGPDEVVATQSGKSKRKRLGEQSDTLPAKQLRKDHPSLATGTGGKTLAGLRQLMPTSPLVLRPSFQADIQAHVVQSARIADVPVYTVAATVTSAWENVGVTPTSDVAGFSQLETSEGSNDSFYELPALNSAEAKCLYVPRWNITNDSLLDDGFSCRTLVDRNAPWLFLYPPKSRAEHELKLKEKLKGKYDARGRLLEEKDLEILRLKSLLAEKAETTEVIRLRDQVSALTGEVSALKSTITQKDADISLLDSRTTYLKSALKDSQAACAEVRSLITSLTSERDRLTSEEEQVQVLYNCVAELEAHVMDMSGRLEGEFYPAYLTTLAGWRWFLTHGIQLDVLKCLKSPKYQGILGHALGRIVDFGMQEGLEAGYEHGVARTQLFAI
ncbi:hypothetical protein Tco_0900831 [Tanacetum coccineum]